MYKQRSMQKSEFDLLMERYITGRVSEEERRKIEAWLDAMGAADDRYPELSEEEEERIFQKLSGGLADAADMGQRTPKRRVSSLQWVVRIAAAVVIVLAAAYAVRYYATPAQDRLETVAANDMERIVLNDGSLVWLRGKSKLRYHEKTGEGSRYAAFEGEALFEIAKDERHPFIVECGDVKIRVLGTSFSIRTSAGQVDLTVLAGSVNFSSATDTQGIDVLPGEKAVYSAGSGFEKLAASPDEISSIVRDTYYNMQFTNVAMEEVINRLEQKFDASISVSDKNILNCRVTIDLTDHSLEKSLQLITEVLNVTYTLESRTVTITGTGCN